MTMSDEKQPTSIIAPPPKAQTLRPVEELARERNMPATALAGMRRANGWAEGKQTTAEEFETAMESYKTKPMGGKPEVTHE